MKKAWILAAICSAWVGCEKKSSSASDDKVAASKTTVKGLAVAPLNLTLKLDASTPTAFKAGTSLAATDSTAICTEVHGGSGDNRTDGFYACMAAYEAREEFFQTGPAVIRNRIESVEGRLNEYVGRLSNYEIPCLDPRNTTSRTGLVVKDAGTNVEEEIAPYALTEFSSKTTFGDGHVLDFDRKYYFSCKNSFSDRLDFDILLGQKDSTWYLGENVGYNASTAADDASTFKTLMSLDGSDNMEIMMSLGNKSLKESSAENPETLGYNALKNGMYKQSAGFIQVVVRPLESIIGASILMNNGCGKKIVMNDVAVYVETNYNNYGLCYDNDVFIDDVDYTGAQYSAAKTTLKGCLRVDGALPQPLLTLDLCEEAGLIVAKDGGGYEDAFSKYGILNLNSNLASPPAQGFAMRAYHGATLWPNMTADINTMQIIYIPDSSELEIENYSGLSYPFGRTNDAVGSDETVVNAACNASEGVREKSFTQNWEIKVSDILAFQEESVPTADLTTTTAADRKAIFLQNLQSDLANTGENTPKVLTKLTRSLGANFRGVGIGSYTLKYDGAALGSASVDQSALAADSGQTEVAIVFESAPTITESGTFTLEYAGKTRLDCNNPIATTRKVNTQLGVASLKLFAGPREQGSK